MVVSLQGKSESQAQTQKEPLLFNGIDVGILLLK